MDDTYRYVSHAGVDICVYGVSLMSITNVCGIWEGVEWYWKSPSYEIVIHILYIMHPGLSFHICSNFDVSLNFIFRNGMPVSFAHSIYIMHLTLCLSIFLKDTIPMYFRSTFKYKYSHFFKKYWKPGTYKYIKHDIYMSLLLDIRYFKLSYSFEMTSSYYTLCYPIFSLA